ncbi:MAG: hypothetical protein DMF72_07685 [Acidobacteria bacterium]|nr:MAG: hypothetical protein DMF72_07685 [Acidobacteriota bacterium]
MTKQAQTKNRRNRPEPSPENSRDGEMRKNRQDEQDIQDARRALKEARKKGSIPWEQVKREVGI